MRRLIALILSLTVVVLVLMPPMRALASGVTINAVISNYANSTTSATTSAFTATPAAGDLLVLAVSFDTATSNLSTTLTGWTLIGMIHNPSYNNTIYLWEKIASGTDTGSVSLTFGASTDYSDVEYDISGENQTTPYEAFATASTTSSLTLQVTSGTPATANDVPIAFFANRGYTTSNPTANWTEDKVAGSSMKTEAQHGPADANSTAQQATLTWSAGDFSVAAILLVEPAAAPAALPSPNPLALAHAGGPHASLALTSSGGGGGGGPTSVFSYAPSFVYMGSGNANISIGNGGDAGNDCNNGNGTNTQLCIETTMLQNLNIRYIEGKFYGSGAPSLNGGLLCNDGQYCFWAAYQTIENQTNENGFQSVCATLDNDASATNPYASGTDPGYYHTTTPTASSNRYVIGSGSCSSLKSGNVYMNPADATGTNGLINAINGAWFNPGVNAGGPEGDHNIYSIWDNMGLNNNAPELGTGTDLQKTQVFVNAYTKLFANFHYPQIFNAVGEEGGFNDGVHHSWATGGAFNCDTNTFQCNDPADFCANDVGSYFKGVQSEEAIFDKTFGDSTFWMQAGADLIDTYAAYSNDANCKGTVDIIPLNQVDDFQNPASATFEQLMRSELLAMRILLTPGSYNGSESAAGPVMEFYSDCYSNGVYVGGAICADQVALYVEQGLQFIPKDTGAANYTGGDDGFGCSTTGIDANAHGGAATFLAYCDASNKDDAGYAGAVLARAGTCYKFGVSIGTCVLLANFGGGQTGATDETIQDSWCSTIDGGIPCSSFPKYFAPGGRGPETCYEDQGLQNAGTNAAGCQDPTKMICPGSNGCQSYWAEQAWANGGVITATLPGTSGPGKLGHCPSPLDVGHSSSNPYLLTEQCDVLLLQQ